MFYYKDINALVWNQQKEGITLEWGETDQRGDIIIFFNAWIVIAI